MDSENKYYKGIALVIGIDNYEHANKLGNAVHDADSIAEALEKLCFYTYKSIDVDIDQFDRAKDDFIKKLQNFDVGVFYFAGHGVEIKGDNYLLATDTPCDSETRLTRYSMKLQAVVDAMNESNCEMKILIIDACRNDPFVGTRGFASMSLAPIFAPKGTIIAYSTSPGEKAMDGGVDKNSIYTGALLSHINELGLPIETFFKKVRTSVYNLSIGKQTSWEHTSLIGSFSFNSGQLIHSLNIPYNTEVVVDKNYTDSFPAIAEIIEGFKSYNYDQQNSALGKFKRIDIKSLNKNQLFVIGRNILQSATGGSWDCENFIKNSQSLSKYTINEENHLLNGILFEIYFDSESHLRNQLKSRCLEDVLNHHNNQSLQCSFDFIHKVLIPFEQKLLFVPSVEMNKVSFDVLLEKGTYKDEFDSFSEDVYFVKSIKKDNNELVAEIGRDNFFLVNRNVVLEDLAQLKNRISDKFCIPERYISITSNIPSPELNLILEFNPAIIE